jgi:Uncharacterised nucleotidyltransferase
MTVIEETSAILESEDLLCTPAVTGPALYEAALLVSLVRGDSCIPDRDTNWETLKEIAKENGVLALAFEALLKSGAEIPDVFAQSAEAIKASATQHAMELRSLLIEFAARQIDVIPLKGPALSLAFYGDMSLRSSSDLDLLVRSKDFARAEEILMGNGFVPRGPRGGYDRRFFRNGLAVELHFHLSLSRSFPFLAEDVWDRSVTTRFLDAPAHAMCKEDLALYLCWHGLKHGFCRLVWILDVARALRGWRDEEYDALVRHARQYDLEPWLLTGCEVVRAMLPLEVAEALDTLIASSPMREHARRAADGILSGKLTKEITDYRCFYLQTGHDRMKRWRYRVSLLRDLLNLNLLKPTPKGSGRASSHRIHHRFVADLRPFRALRKYGVRRACRMLFPSRA